MNSTIDDGVIKFNYNLDKKNLLNSTNIQEIEVSRSKLFKLKLIGQYLPEQIGYGNISKRYKHNKMIISGTQTGKYPNLDFNKYCIVDRCDLEQMSVQATGTIAPSSESLTHYGIYYYNKKINYIYHIHDSKIWTYMINNQFSATDKNIPYGTKSMSLAAKECIHGRSKGSFVMKGHKDGVISYGSTAKEAEDEIINLYNIVYKDIR
ncbi:MAG: class II aldolase/adducin family protein [Bacteriovoracaceae bacterium]|jgi:ribulose-5-phosphate 4-epimerase/fuculose-1-phosphate aldolase|nr:class II aldolase/adducin family protein [Bacteriovoracaceae bacterium]